MSVRAKAAVKRTTPAPPPAATAPARQWPWTYAFFASCALALLVFSPALNGSFIFDDFHLPFADPRAATMPAAFWIGGARPMLTATYWANFLIHGTRPFGYHLVNVFLHAITGVLVFFIFDRILAISRVPTLATPERRRWFALFGAALFLLHPLQTEPVDYIAGRSDLVSGLFFFAAWLVFLRRFEQRTSLFVALEICLLAGLGVLSKESAISLPALLLLTDLYFSDGSLKARAERRSILYSLFLAGGLAAVVVILRSLRGAASAGFSAGISPFEYALTQCRVILIYLRLFLIPAGQNGDWDLPFYRSFADGAAAAYVLGLLLLIALVVWLYKRERLISYGLAAFLIMLAPTSSIVPIKDAIAERRMYLPIAGLILALLGAAAKVGLTPAWRRAAAVAILVLCAALSWHRSAVWSSDFNLWSDSLRGNPANSRAHFGLGSAMVLRGDCAGAVREFSLVRARQAEAQAQDLTMADILGNLAMAYQCDNMPSQALEFYRSLAAVQPGASVFDSIGFIEATLGHPDAALDAFEHALKLDANDANAWAYRGIAKLSLNDATEARTDLRHALELDPGNAAAAAGMAKLPSEH